MELNHLKFWELVDSKKAVLQNLKVERENVVAQNQPLIDQKIQEKFKEFIALNKESIVSEVLGDTLKEIDSKVEKATLELNVLEQCILTEQEETTTDVPQDETVTEGENN